MCRRSPLSSLFPYPTLFRSLSSWRPPTRAGQSVCPLLLQNRRLPYCQGELNRCRLGTANDRQADLVAWLVQDQTLEQLVGVGDVEAVEAHDHVAGLDAGLGRWR